MTGLASRPNEGYVVRIKVFYYHLLNDMHSLVRGHYTVALLVAMVEKVSNTFFFSPVCTSDSKLNVLLMSKQVETTIFIFHRFLSTTKVK